MMITLVITSGKIYSISFNTLKLLGQAYVNPILVIELNENHVLCMYVYMYVCMMYVCIHTYIIP